MKQEMNPATMPAHRHSLKIVLCIACFFACTTSYSQEGEAYKIMPGAFCLFGWGWGQNQATVAGINAELPISKKFTLQAAVGAVVNAQAGEMYWMDNADNEYYHDWQVEWDSQKMGYLVDAGVNFHLKGVHTKNSWTFGSKLRYLQTHIRGTHKPCYDWEYDAGTFLFWDYSGWSPASQALNSFEMTDHHIDLLFGAGYHSGFGNHFVLGFNAEAGIGMVMHRSDNYQKGIPEPTYDGFVGEHVTAVPSAEKYKSSSAELSAMTFSVSLGYKIF